MNEPKYLKQKIVNYLLESVNVKIENLQRSIDSVLESRDNETKSSVGDKYETGRAMMQLEIEKNKVLLNKTLNLKNELSQIDIRKTSHKVEFGSVVKTENLNYFISIGNGKIEIDDEIYYDVSAASPVGKLLLNKKQNDKIVLQGKEIKITSIF